MGEEKELTWSRACAEDRESVIAPMAASWLRGMLVLQRRRMPWPELHTQPKSATSS